VPESKFAFSGRRTELIGLCELLVLARASCISSLARHSECTELADSSDVWRVACHVPCVMCHVSRVTCHVWSRAIPLHRIDSHCSVPLILLTRRSRHRSNSLNSRNRCEHKYRSRDILRNWSFRADCIALSTAGNNEQRRPNQLEQLSNVQDIDWEQLLFSPIGLGQSAHEIASIRWRPCTREGGRMRTERSLCCLWYIDCSMFSMKFGLYWLLLTNFKRQCERLAMR
jgi:hypothetical protein